MSDFPEPDWWGDDPAAIAHRRRVRRASDKAPGHTDLAGNHDRCEKCTKERAKYKGPIPHGAVPCDECGGLGYIPLSIEEIARRMSASGQGKQG